MTHIFVYGTLKKGQPNHDRMLNAANGRAEFLGCARTIEKYPLVIAGKYNIPFLLNVPGQGQRVHGEVYIVDDKMLKFLDWFESCPQMYQRSRVLLEMETGEDTRNMGNSFEVFTYSTSTHKPEWLLNPTFESYDSHGDHGLLYVTREARDLD